MLQSFDGDARQVLLQLLHTANRNAGLLPPMQEVATLMGWPLARVDAAMETLEARDVIGPLPDTMKAEFPGQYMARWASHTDALLRMEKRAQLAEKAVLDFEEQRDVERDLRAEVAELTKKLNGPKLNSKKWANMERKKNARIKELEDALELTQQLIERAPYAELKHAPHPVKAD